MPFGIPSEDFHGGFGLPHDDGFTDEEYNQIAEDNFNEKVYALTEASAEISALRDDGKKMFDTLMKTCVALGIALRDYKGPYQAMLKTRKEEAETLCMFMYNRFGGEE
jgi:hypothetical protein